VRIARIAGLKAGKIDAGLVFKKLERLRVVAEIGFSRLAGKSDIVEVNPIDAVFFNQFGHQADFVGADFRQSRIDRTDHFAVRPDNQPFRMLPDLTEERPFRENTEPGMNCHVSLAGFAQESTKEIPVISRIFNADVAVKIDIAAGVFDQHDERINAGPSIVIEHGPHLRDGFILPGTEQSGMHPDSADPGILSPAWRFCFRF